MQLASIKWTYYIPHKAAIFSMSKHGLGDLSLKAFDALPVSECVAKTSRDQIISIKA